MGVWLRLPCCEAETHPVEIASVHDGVMEITAPRGPHQPASRGKHERSEVTLVWSGDGGTLGLSCQVVDFNNERWSLRVTSTGNFVQRRRFLRVYSNCVANLMDGQVDRMVTGKVLDISEGGMKVEFAGYVPNPNQPINRWAIRVDGTALVIVAKMSWANRVGPLDFHAGFEFLEVHDSTLTHLRAHIMSQLVQHGPMPDTRDEPPQF